jgi:hypothetical protein
MVELNYLPLKGKSMKVKYSFSLPFRPGMESKPGYVKTVDKAYESFPGETKFAVFTREKELNRKDFKETDEVLINKGMAVLGQNVTRMADMGVLAKEYGITIAGAVGGITKTDKGLISAMGMLTQDTAKIAAAFTKKTGKAITVDEVKEILAG